MKDYQCIENVKEKHGHVCNKCGVVPLIGYIEKEDMTRYMAVCKCTYIDGIITTHGTLVECTNNNIEKGLTEDDKNDVINFVRHHELLSVEESEILTYLSDKSKMNDNCSLCDCYSCENQCSNCVSCNGNVLSETNRERNKNWIENCLEK